jgi:alkylation response protein AidB-like acyl-CoA dehydrogenase
MTLENRLRELYLQGGLEIPARGQTALRHRKLAELARQDLPLARLAEAHLDAIAILAEAGMPHKPGLYGVWAAETAGLRLELHNGQLTGKKMFCSGAGLLDHALVTVGDRLVDVSLRDHPDTLSVDLSAWKIDAFAETNTAAVTFAATPAADVVGETRWYLNRPGFWHGACGPAACWAGGAMALYDCAAAQQREDPHTMAHLAAMHANVWAMAAYLQCAGAEIDSAPCDRQAAIIRALSLRHLIEQAASDILRRFGRAYGPRALAYDAAVSKLYREVELYIRQSHAERDLEVLGRQLTEKWRFPECTTRS